MTFVRIKHIKGRPYAYLVENAWKGNRSRQTVRAYLGKVMRFPATSSAPAPHMSGDFRSCVDELIAWNLQRMGFTKKGNGLVKGPLTFLPDCQIFLHRLKPQHLAIQHQQGFLCTHTLHNLAAFRPYGSDQESGIRLAKAVVDAGLEVPKELFVALFEKARSQARKPLVLDGDIYTANSQSQSI